MLPKGEAPCAAQLLAWEDLCWALSSYEGQLDVSRVPCNHAKIRLYLFLANKPRCKCTA